MGIEGYKAHTGAWMRELKQTIKIMAYVIRLNNYKPISIENCWHCLCALCLLDEEHGILKVRPLTMCQWSDPCGLY